MYYLLSVHNTSENTGTVIHGVATLICSRHTMSEALKMKAYLGSIGLYIRIETDERKGK